MTTHGTRHGHWRSGGILLLALALAMGLLAGCGGAPKKPDEQAKVSEEQLRKQEEARRKAEDEARKKAEEARIAEEKRQTEALIATVGSVGEPPPLGPLPEPRVEGIPFDEAVPPLPKEPHLRVAVLAHGAPAGTGRQVAALIGTYERDRLEDRLGMAVSITYVADTTRPLTHESEVHYRPDYLRAAQSLAAVLSADQWIGPMTAEESDQANVDVVVHLGKDYH